MLTKKRTKMNKKITIDIKIDIAQTNEKSLPSYLRVFNVNDPEVVNRNTHSITFDVDYLSDGDGRETYLEVSKFIQEKINEIQTLIIKKENDKSY
jgi:hypothetical protein